MHEFDGFLELIGKNEGVVGHVKKTLVTTAREENEDV
jgi:hypothetical protein